MMNIRLTKKECSISYVALSAGIYKNSIISFNSDFMYLKKWKSFDYGIVPSDIMTSEIKNPTIMTDFLTDVVIRTLKIEEMSHKINVIHENLIYFEKKYGMKSEEFYKKYVDGTLGDDMDFLEWKASIEIYNELKK